MHGLSFPNIELDAQHCMNNHCAHVWNHRFSVSACKNSPQYSHKLSNNDCACTHSHMHTTPCLSPTLKDTFWRKHKSMPLNILAYTCARKKHQFSFQSLSDCILSSILSRTYHPNPPCPHHLAWVVGGVRNLAFQCAFHLHQALACELVSGIHLAENGLSVRIYGVFLGVAFL